MEARDLPGINSALGAKYLEPIPMLTRAQWEGVAAAH